MRLQRALLRGCCLAPFALALLHCRPDFDSLSSGASAGAPSGGITAFGGGGQTASAGTAGDRSQAGGGSAGTTQALGGSPASGGDTAGGAGGVGGVTDSAAGEAGSMPIEPCVSSHANALAFDGFDAGLTGGIGFAPAIAVAAQATTNGSTASVAWDAAVGKSCPGAFRVTGDFKGYSSSSKEIAIGDVRFPAADWSGGIALHAWVKVDPSTAPLQGIQLFVVSGSGAQLFASVFDSSAFSFGEWYEMVVPLQTGTSYDPKTVLRVGVQIVLKAAGSPGIPVSPPATSAWLDDIWVEQ